MFSQIKAMIKEKRTFQESADLILKDTIDSDLDDMIILGESTNIPMMESEDYDSPEMESDDHDDDDDEKEEKDGEEKDEDGENDLIDQKIDDDHDDKDDNSPVDYSILDDKMDDNENEDEPEYDTPVLPDENQSSNDDLMNSPINDTSCDNDPNCQNNKDIIDDILNVDIDIRSNTLANTIPVAPDDAQSAVAASSDELNSAISRLNQNLESARSILDENVNPDSSKSDRFEERGDGCQDVEKKMDTNKKSSPKSDDHIIHHKESAESEFSLFDEAISLGDDSATSPEADGSDTAPTDDGTENKVTAAVRDKVNDTAPDADMGAEDDTNSAELSASSDAGNDNKDKLLKKLSDITKNLEDAKKAIMDNLS